jgi:hypothetical protein
MNDVKCSGIYENITRVKLGITTALDFVFIGQWHSRQLTIDSLSDNY